MSEVPREETDQATDRVLVGLGDLGWLGVVAMVVLDAYGSVVSHDYDPISQTVSLLARHRFSLPQDLGLYLLGAGTIAAGLGLRRYLPPHRGTRTLAWLTVVAGVDVYVLTAFDLLEHQLPYAQEIHLLTSGLMAALFIVVSFLFAGALGTLERAYARWSLGIGVVFTAMVGVYFFMPTGWDGLYERLVILDGLVWLAMVSSLLIRRGRDGRRWVG